jgi:hypothetical protein
VHIRADAPLTAIYHRDGFYDFAPVEFIHSRRLWSDLYFTGGGMIPSSRGKFAHAAYTGQVLMADLARRIWNWGELEMSVATGKHRTELAFADSVRTIHRSDFDLHFKTAGDSSRRMEMNLYSVRQEVSYGGLGREGREAGFVGRVSRGPVGAFLRVSGLSGAFPGQWRRRELELASSASLTGAKGVFAWGLMGGATGWWPKGIGLAAAACGRWSPNPQMELVAQFTQCPAPRPLQELPGSPLLLTDVFRPDEYTIPDSSAGVLPMAVARNACLGVQHQIPFGRVDLMGFAGSDLRPAIWHIEPDSAVTLKSIPKRTSIGMQLTVRIQPGRFRAILAVAEFERRGSGMESGDFLYPQPPLQGRWEFGWHNLFWNSAFEADVCLGGKYYRPFYGWNRGRGERLGGAYPMDFRITARIYRFNLYYGIHNWNAYPYYLVPGYKMMHREEYWGVNWLFVD